MTPSRFTAEPAPESTAAAPPPAAPPPAVGWAGLLSGANALRSLALCGGVALHAINLFIATTILPSVVRDIGGLPYYAWNTTLFVVASILGSTLSARLLRRVGPRAAYAWAAAVFAAGAVVCALAPSMPVLLVGRTVQGLGGGLLVALPFAMIRFLFAEALWPRAMALISGMWGVATLLGPAVGGVFAQMDAWRAAFWGLLPAVGLFVLLAAFGLPRRRIEMQASTPLAWPQLLLLVAAVLAVSAGSVLGSDSGSWVWPLAGVTLAMGVCRWLAWAESRASHRLLPRGALQLASPLGPLYATMALLAIAVTCTEVFVPLFLQTLHGRTPLQAGYMAAVMSVGWTSGSLLSAGAGPARVRWVLRASPLLTLAGMIGLAVWVPQPGTGAWGELALLCVALVLSGAGVGTVWPHLATRVLQTAPGDEQALAASSITTVQLFATALGSALAGVVANAAGLVEPGGAQGVANAARWLFGVFAVAPLLALITAARIARTD